MIKLLSAVLAFSVFNATAQQSVWQGSKEQLEQVREKGGKQVSKLKQWRKHIEEWGLDPNYNHSLSLSGRLHTNGWSGGLYCLTQKSAGKKVIWQLHFSEVKHEKESKQQQTRNTYPYLGETKPYIFGKINNAYTLQLGYGREQMLFPALLEGNLSVSLRYSGGPALALLKPYFLNLIYVAYTPDPVAHLQSERYSPANTANFLQPGLDGLP